MSNTNKAVKAKASKKPSKPLLQDILDAADKAYTSITKKYYCLGTAYVAAIDYYGAEGRRAFKVRFPLTDNALRNLELVGRGRLLPQFAMCSNRFTTGLANMDDSLDWQYKLLGASKNGYVRVRSKDGRILDKKFEEFVNADEVDAVLSVVSAANKDLSVDELSKKLSKMVSDARAKFKKGKRDPFVISMGADGKHVVRFYKATPYTAEDLNGIIEQIKARDTAATV
jgi:hypothetical protein